MPSTLVRLLETDQIGIRADAAGVGYGRSKSLEPLAEVAFYEDTECWVMA